jgi:hypothetical protein
MTNSNLLLYAVVCNLQDVFTFLFAYVTFKVALKILSDTVKKYL